MLLASVLFMPTDTTDFIRAEVFKSDAEMFSSYLVVTHDNRFLARKPEN